MEDYTKREQKLVDICFQLVLAITSKEHVDIFKKKPINERAAWVADQLNKCGFRNVPVGSSWGVLVSQELYDKIKADDKKIL